MGGGSTKKQSTKKETPKKVAKKNVTFKKMQCGGVKKVYHGLTILSLIFNLNFNFRVSLGDGIRKITQFSADL